MSPLELPPDVTTVLSEGRQFYVGLVTQQGPHVTPELYTWSDDRLWFAAATSTVKARVLETGAPVAGAVVGRGRTVIVEGTVEVFDPRRPLERARLHSMPQAVRALASFGLRNTADLVGFARDTLTGALGKQLPKPRALMAVAPTRAVLVENDQVTWSAGWAEPSRVVIPATEVPTGGEFAVAALDGPHLVPARWFADESRLFVAPDLLALIHALPRSGMAVVDDAYNAPGPAAKEGALLRGEGEVGDDGWISFNAARAVEWEGTTTRRTSPS